MEINLIKKARIPAGILTALIVIITALDGKVFFKERFSCDALLYVLCFVAAFIIGAMTLYRFEIKNKKISIAVNAVIFLLSPVAVMTMTECLNNIFVYDMTYLGFFGNYVVILIFNLIVFALSGSIRLPFFTVAPFLYIFALINFFVKEFRGTPFIPMDFASVTTAMNVSSEYNYQITHQVLIASIILIFLIVLGAKLKTPEFNLRGKLISRITAFVFSAAILITFYTTDFFADLGVKPDFWNQTRGYKRYGFVCSFFVNTKYLFVTTPAGYNAQIAEEHIEETLKNAEEQSDGKETKTPDIICIMNESLSDLSVIGDLKTNMDYMPFMKSLEENTIKGNLFVPVIGAGTSNSEFEFITGNTTAFLPGGSNAYMLYIKDKAASMVSTLSAQGYECVAFHPYYASGWNRVNVYDAFGFSLFKSLGNLMDLSIMQKYQQTKDVELLQRMTEEQYPGTNMLMRAYISDSYNYKVLIEDYENRDTSKPYFVFNVTMQNHGAYNNSASNFPEDVKAVGMSKDYPLANQYLSLVKQSDIAFEELINYFSKVDEPVIICMFGDHQPSIETAFYQELFGKNLNSLTQEEIQKRYTTPFFIWANYDIPEETIECMSANYLSSYVLKTAGVELSDYNKYLLKLYETLPVIDNMGYIDKDGNHYTWTQTSEYSSLLQKYQYVQYNNMFDKSNNLSSVFYLGE